jgi:dTDP-4-dehydrorhamnose reductase
MKILVAGARGQLAQALAAQADIGGKHAVVALGRPDLDLLRPDTITRALAEISPTIVVNAAAYTAVDHAESDAGAAFALNRDGAGSLAAAARACGCPIIHISTDYVFDGTKATPYCEDDATSPASVYGHSKLAGERAVAAANPEHMILRTAWVFSANASNFLLTMLRLARERPELRVVADQQGNPTYAPHLADAILAIVDKIGTAPRDSIPWGILHAAGNGDATWHTLAEAIIAAGRRLGVPEVPIRAITTAEYPTPARRPANSRLDCTKLAQVFGIRVPPWREGVDAAIAELAQR